MALFAHALSDQAPVRRLVGMVLRILSLQPVRFVIVGGLNTVFGYGLFTVFYLLSHHRQLSLVASTAVAVLFNYFTTGRLVFANRGFKAMIPFFLGYGVVLIVNMASLEILTRAAVHTLVAQAISLPLMVVLSYVINRYVVFAGSRRPPRDR
jgi:putative flippase GtrA